MYYCIHLYWYVYTQRTSFVMILQTQNVSIWAQIYTVVATRPIIIFVHCYTYTISDKFPLIIHKISTLSLMNKVVWIVAQPLPTKSCLSAFIASTVKMKSFIFSSMPFKSGFLVAYPMNTITCTTQKYYIQISIAIHLSYY